MKVGEFIEQLQEFDPEMEIITARDSEGNGYHIGVDAQLEMYRQEGREIHIISPDDFTDGYEEGTYSPNCVVIWP